MARAQLTDINIRMGRAEKADNMAFFRRILSQKRVDTDMEAGNLSDVELDDMEAGSGGAPSLNPDALGSFFPYSFPAPNTVPNATSPLSSPAQISSTMLNTNRKRSQSDDRISKVRVVEQGSKISTIVRIYFP